MYQFDDKLRFTKAVYYCFKPIALPHPFKDATGGFGTYAPLQGWVELHDAEGCVCGNFCSAGFVRNLLPLILTGETKTYDEWYRYLYWKLRNFGFQSGEIADLGQLDIMMMALLAERRGLPLHRFLGAKKDWASVYKGGGAIILNDDELVDDMVRYVREGYRTVKFKVGSEDGKNLERDVQRMRRVRAEVGDDIEIAVDGNQVWDVPTALRFADLVREFRPAWFEEPVHSHDMRGIRSLVEQNVGMPLGYGESMRNHYAFESYVESGVRHLMPLIGRISGVNDLMMIRGLARDNHLRYSSGGTTYLNAAFGALYDEDEQLEFHEPIIQPIGEWLSVKPEAKDGRMYLPDVNGMPIRIDLKKLDDAGKIEGVQYYYAESASTQFAVRASY